MRGYLRSRDRRKPENRKGPCRVWQLVVERPVDVNGRRNPVYRTFHGGKGEAEAALRALITEVESGAVVIGGDVLLSSWLETWLQHKTDGIKPVRASTLHSYRRLMEQHVLPAFGTKALSSITALQVQRLSDKLATSGRLTFKHVGEPLSPSTVRAVMQAFSACMKHAVRLQLIARNPVSLVETPRVQRKRVAALDVDQARRLLEAASGTRLAVPIVVSAMLGPRRGEVFALKWSDIDFGKRTISIERTIGRGRMIAGTKTESGTRIIPMPDEVATALRTLRAAQAINRVPPESFVDQGFIFTDASGRVVNPNGITTLFQRILRDAGLPKIRWHDLRHSAASILIGYGVPIPVVSEILGHADTAITMRTYAHALPNGKRDAADLIGKLLG